jgi:hypothetical protein
MVSSAISIEAFISLMYCGLPLQDLHFDVEGEVLEDLDIESIAEPLGP